MVGIQGRSCRNIANIGLDKHPSQRFLPGQGRKTAPKRLSATVF